MKVRDVIATNPFTLPPSASVAAAAIALADPPDHRRGDGKVVGIVTRTDILRGFFRTEEP